MSVTGNVTMVYLSLAILAGTYISVPQDLRYSLWPFSFLLQICLLNFSETLRPIQRMTLSRKIYNYCHTFVITFYFHITCTLHERIQISPDFRPFVRSIIKRILMRSSVHRKIIRMPSKLLCYYVPLERTLTFHLCCPEVIFISIVKSSMVGYRFCFIFLHRTEFSGKEQIIRKISPVFMENCIDISVRLQDFSYFLNRYYSKINNVGLSFSFYF